MKRILAMFLLVLGFVAFAGVNMASAQTDTFMLLPNIKGSSIDDKHKDWIDVVSLTQTLEATGTGPTAGQPQRRAQCSLEVMKGLDIAGPLIWGAAVSGQVFGLVQIDVRRHGDERQQVFYQIKLRNAIIANISTVVNGGYVERVILMAGSVELTYFPQNPDGTIGAPISSAFRC